MRAGTPGHCFTGPGLEQALLLQPEGAQERVDTSYISRLE